MKLLMLIVDETKKEELEVILDGAGVVGYTEITHATGTGRTGPRLGSGAFPRTSAVILTVLADEAVGHLAAEIKTYCKECEEPLKMIVWSVEEVL